MRIDINADLGEECGDDAAMLAVVSSANVACGLHAGGPGTLHATVRLAGDRGVAVGAHISYPDRAGFGRRAMTLPTAELTAVVSYQLGAFQATAAAAGAPGAGYVKPHGALYHAVAEDRDVAAAVVAAMRAVDPGLALVGLPGTQAGRAAERAGLRFVAEGFADRAYRPDGSLVPRGAPGAVLDDPAEVARRCVRLAVEGSVVAADGSVVRLGVETVCVHGDSPAAVAMATSVRHGLEVAGVTVAAWSAASSS